MILGRIIFFSGSVCRFDIWSISRTKFGGNKNDNNNNINNSNNATIWILATTTTHQQRLPLWWLRFCSWGVIVLHAGDVWGGTACLKSANNPLIVCLHYLRKTKETDLAGKAALTIGKKSLSPVDDDEDLQSLRPALTPQPLVAWAVVWLVLVNHEIAVAI